MDKRFLVIGLGILGESVAKTLASEGAEVIALDSNPVYIDRIKDRVALAVTGDSTDPKLLDQLGAASVDGAIVCIGENFAGAVLTTAHLLDLKVKNVACRATNELNASILKKMGAHDVFFVESEMGKAIAHRLLTPSILHEMDLGNGFRIVEYGAQPWMTGKSLSELALPKNYGVQVVAIRDTSNMESVQIPTPNSIIMSHHRLLMAGLDEGLQQLLSRSAEVEK